MKELTKQEWIERIKGHKVIRLYDNFKQVWCGEEENEKIDLSPIGSSWMLDYPFIQKDTKFYDLTNNYLLVTSEHQLEKAMQKTRVQMGVADGEVIVPDDSETIELYKIID